MNSDPIFQLADLVSEAHARIQQDFPMLDPVVGISRGMRNSGIPADAMTIDCLKSGKRIIVIAHDGDPNRIRYQFSYKDQDPGADFTFMDISTVTAQTFYDWMSDYLG